MLEVMCLHPHINILTLTIMTTIVTTAMRLIITIMMTMNTAIIPMRRLKKLPGAVCLPWAFRAGLFRAPLPWSFCLAQLH